MLRWVEGIGNRCGIALGLELIRAGRALGELPFVAEQVLEEVVAPLCRRFGPGDFRAAGDRVRPLAGAVIADPAEALLLDGGGFRLGPEQRRVARTVGLAEAMPAGDERHRLLVVHRHALEGLANVDGGGERIRLAVRAFRIHIDETHLHRGKGILEVTLARIALVVEPGVLLAPVGVFFWLPHIGAPAAEAECRKAHRLESDVAGEHQQVGPRDLVAVFLLDRPQQAARLVEVGIVGPRVEGRETLLAGAGAAATVTDAVGARGMPGHAYEESAIVAEVSRPPVLALRHQGGDILLEGLEIERLECLGIVEPPAHGTGQGRVLVQHSEIELVRPPVAVRPHSNRRGPVHDRALAFNFLVHIALPW